jgi:transcriptional regulator with XRE-family HTH domain
MTIDTKKTRNRIAELRKSKKLTIQQVADGIGVSNGTISRYEQGTREPKLDTWQKLANFFNVSVSYITGVSDEPGKDTGRLQGIREDKGMSYQQVADAYNQEADRLSVFDHKEPHIDAETVQAIETGNYQPSQHEWKLLAWGLDVPEFYLSGHSNDKVGWQEWADATGYSIEQLRNEVKRLVDTGRLHGNSDIQHQISCAVQSLDQKAPTTTNGTINCVQDKLLELLNYIDQAFILKARGSKIKPGNWQVRPDMDEKAYNQLLDMINKARYEIGQITPKK